MAAPTFEALQYEVKDHIATITLNRPEAMNSFNGAMARDLRAVWDETDRDDDVRCVIVTGAGRAFCAGADLSGGGFGSRSGTASAGDPPPEKVGRDGAGLVTLRIFESLKPVIGAVNGAAVGVGVTMLLPMDIRLASTEARFGLVFSRRGIVLEGASSYFLPRLVGIQTMLEWCYSGRVFPAAEAHERGLIRSVHAPGDLLPAARELAKDIVENAAPVAVTLTRQMAWRMMGASHPMEAHRAESLALHYRYRSNDVKEGVASFMQKRPPDFAEKVPSNLPDIWPGWVDPPFET
jgi:enoyl-CoA hydratase/carnithine racemase